MTRHGDLPSRSASPDPAELLGIASDVLDSVAQRFAEGLAAPRAVEKGDTDFATEIDLEIERIVSAELSERTGLPVHGEEFGGPDVSTQTTWVLDPVDGTFNYSAGLPLAGTLLALVHEGKPIVGLTWLPLTGERFAAVEGGPLLKNSKPLPSLAHGDITSSLIGFGSLVSFTSASFRMELFQRLHAKTDRIRMHGSVGVDLAYTAAGVLGGCIAFGNQAWDNAPGALLVQAAGGIVTDLAGEPWTLESKTLVAAAPGIHEAILDVVASAHCSDAAGNAGATELRMIK